MKKLLAVLSVAALLVPTLAFAAAGDVSMTTDASFLVNGIPINVSGSAVSVSSLTVNGTSIVFTLVPADTFTISAPNFNVLNTDKGTGLTNAVCNATQSLLTYAGTTGTVTVTPSTTLCTDAPGSQGANSVVTSTLAPVNLGSAANFAILSKSGISTTGVTSITGNIGVSPIAATGITGFGLTMDSSNAFSTSAEVSGKAYASDYATPTPTTMTTAISDMQTAYTDAAGRTNPTVTELGAEISAV